jgi:hypothetical protein
VWTFNSGNDGFANSGEANFDFNYNGTTGAFQLYAQVSGGGYEYGDLRRDQYFDFTCATEIEIVVRKPYAGWASIQPYLQTGSPSWGWYNWWETLPTTTTWTSMVFYLDAGNEINGDFVKNDVHRIGVRVNSDQAQTLQMAIDSITVR